MTANTALAPRGSALRAGIRVEIVTVAWMLVEAVVAIAAGVLARSVLLTAFGLDSVIELISGGVLLWRLSVEARGARVGRVASSERRAAWVTAALLSLLCVYVVATVFAGLITQTHPDGSTAGIVLAGAAVLVMPLLARSKRRIADEIESSALRGDAACSITCAYMAGALLLGLICSTAFGWWWADYAAAVALLIWLVPETREVLNGARNGSSCDCC
jgi:divalent metal cation (Fe/Co/Zn/Cd) transporter